VAAAKLAVYSVQFDIQYQRKVVYKRCNNIVSPNSGAGTNLKVGGGTDPAQSERKNFYGVPLHLLALKAQLVVLVSAFVMVSTVWSVSCLLFYSRCPPAQPFVKVGGGAI